MENMQNKKEIFKIIHEAVKLTPKVISYFDETESHKIDIYIGENRPDVGLTTYSTIGLSEYPIEIVDRQGREIRVEFIGMCTSEFTSFPNILASCAFNIIKDHYSYTPGMVNMNVIDDYYKNLEMRHIYYTIPSYWEDLQGHLIDGHIVNWLFAIPISDNELDYLNENGVDAGFIKAGELIVGDELLDVNGNVLLVENFDVELTDEPVKVYNFEVEDFHTYHVCTLGVLVHNAGKNYASLEPDKYTELTQSEVKDILKERGLDEQAAQNLIDSFDGPIYKREGFEGEAFTITESNAGEASGVFVTRESAGITPTERINNLALPPNNTAMAESTVQLTRSQILLEGKVAAQPDWAVIADDGIPRSGGGWQVVTDGGKYNGAIER